MLSFAAGEIATGSQSPLNVSKRPIAVLNGLLMDGVRKLCTRLADRAFHTAGFDQNPTSRIRHYLAR